jgi:iron(III) transport system ATP-binding protein
MVKVGVNTNHMIRINGLKKSYFILGATGKTEQVKAVDGVSLNIEEGCFYTLLGPSGCGKTTILRSVAGLERPEDGEIVIGNKTVYSPQGVWVLPNKRGIGMVFQSYAIWPHMTVFENVAFPLTEGVKTFSKTEITEKVRSALELVHLEGLESRPAPQLSGGQQQRLALARALVGEPNILLLDEPLSNLDARLRDEMRTEIRRLAKGLGITTIYVTHDQIEALALSDQIAVMNKGKILQIGSPRELYQSPHSLFAAQFIGSNNFVRGTVTQCQRGGRSEVDAQGTTLIISEPLDVKNQVLLVIRPHDIKLMEFNQSSHEENTVQGQISRAVFIGEVTEYEVETKSFGGKTLLVKGSTYLDFKEGEQVLLSFPADRLRVIRDDETLLQKQADEERPILNS